MTEPRAVAPGASEEPARWAWAEVDLGAITANLAWLRRTVAPAEIWAVVKGSGYGHGAVPAAEAALAGGASGLCVALVQEGIELRAAGLRAPVLVLSEPPPTLMPELARHDLRVTLYTARGVDAAAAAAGPGGVTVHLKIDTGMRRVGAEPVDALAIAQRIQGHRALHLEGIFTHLAVADEPDHPTTDLQLDRFDEVLARLAAHGISPPIVHAANSAGGIAHRRARRSLVRAGIAIYGLAPAPQMAEHTRRLRPALSLRARVSHVKPVRAGEQVSYGLRHTFEQDTVVATLPIGYADGVPRRLSATGGQVLIGGRRNPIVGVVTMDQLMVDCGPGSEVQVGDEAVLIGRQGAEEVTADEWAERLGTISYEIVCAVGPRVPRSYRSPPGLPGDGR